MKNIKTADTVFRMLRILLIAVLIVSLAYFSFKTVNIWLEDIEHAGENNFFSGYLAMWFAGSVILAIINICVLVIFAVMYILSKKIKIFKENPLHRSRGYFLLFPFVSQILYSVLLPCILSLFSHS